MSDHADWLTGQHPPFTGERWWSVGPVRKVAPMFVKPPSGGQAAANAAPYQIPESRSMEEMTPHRRTGRSRLVLGVFLLALGGLMLAINLGYDLPRGWWRYFPVPLIAFGLWGLILPNRHLDRSGGIWLLASGIYCLIGVFNLFALSWGTAWPIFVIAAGLSFMVRGYPSDPQRTGTPPGA